ncbi:MAG: DUF2157 domain-containing protein [Wenzhouxiangellaceae bacterium]
MSSSVESRHDALERIAALAEEYGITTGEIAERLGADAGGRRGDRLIRRILAYLGAIFVLAGAVTAANMFWADLGSPARVIASLGSGLVALVLAVATSRDHRYQAASTPLFLIAALLQTAGLFVFLDEYSSGREPALGAMAVFGVMTVQSLLLLSSIRRTSLAFLSVLFGFAFLASALSWLDVDGGFSALVIGVSGLLVSWGIHSTAYRAFTPLTFFVFGGCLAFGAFDLVEGEFPLDFVLVGVAAVLVYAGVLARSRSLLVAGVLSMLAYLGYFTDEYFADMLSWPVALIVMGLLMLGLSSYAVKLGRGMQPRA